MPMSYLVPTVIEQSPRGERAYDIYSRLLKDRIVVLGTEINDTTANLLTAQLLHLEAEDPERTSACTSTARADRSPPPLASTTPCSSSAPTSRPLPGHGRLGRGGAAGRGAPGKRLALPNCPGADPPAPWRGPGPVDRHRESGPGDRLPPGPHGGDPGASTPVNPASASPPTPTATTSWGRKRPSAYGLVDEVLQPRRLRVVRRWPESWPQPERAPAAQHPAPAPDGRRSAPWPGSAAPVTSPGRRPPGTGPPASGPADSAPRHREEATVAGCEHRLQESS